MIFRKSQSRRLRIALACESPLLYFVNFRFRRVGRDLFCYNITNMRLIAENANDFVDLRTADGGNCVYVDRTDYFHQLVTAGSKKLFFIGLAFDSQIRRLVDAAWNDPGVGRRAWAMLTETARA